jgi:hypothetical protein
MLGVVLKSQYKKPSMIATDERLTVSQAARLAGVSEGSIRSWAKAGIVNCEQTPLGRLISARSLGQVIAAREAEQRERSRRGGSHD